jgi:hypothetical protein
VTEETKTGTSIEETVEIELREAMLEYAMTNLFDAFDREAEAATYPLPVELETISGDTTKVEVNRITRFDQYGLEIIFTDVQGHSWRAWTHAHEPSDLGWEIELQKSD